MDSEIECLATRMLLAQIAGCGNDGGLKAGQLGRFSMV
jgi:predicted small lipoprotein YifL